MTLILKSWTRPGCSRNARLLRCTLARETDHDSHGGL